MRDKEHDLTEEEKWICVAMWINALYREHLSDIPMEFIVGEHMSVKEHLRGHKNYHPCCICPIYDKKCKEHWKPPQINFKIIEQFTGPNTIMGYTLPYDCFKSHHEERKVNL